MTLPAPAVESAPPADGDLVERARSGDRDACTELADRHRRAAYLLALQLVGDVELAMDVTQDALLRFLTHLHRFDTARPVRPWLYQIVRNRVRALARRRKVRRHVSIDAPPEQAPPPIRSQEPTPEDRAELSQLRRHIWSALSRLSAAHKEILVLREYQDLAYAEIAEVLGIPVGTVMSRLHAARRKLREELRSSATPLEPFSSESTS